MPSPAIWVDGEPATALPLPDRGLDFGDGLFETLLLRQGRPVLLELHLERLAAGLQVLSFPDCLSQAREYLAIASDALAEVPWTALRLTVTRGTAPRGYAPPQEAVPRIVISAAKLEQDRDRLPGAIALAWAEISWSSQPLLAGIKHLNRLEQVLAANEARSKDVDEVVVLDALGNVCSLSSGNLFIFEQGRLLTPALETAGIAGTRRRLIIERLAPSLGLEVEEAHIQPQQLETASEVICCNSIRGLQPVARLDDNRWTDHTLCRALHEQYRDLLAC